MTNDEFKTQIEAWLVVIETAGIRQPNGRPFPQQAFHVFFGVGLSTFKKMVSGQSSIREIQPYTARAVELARLLPEQAFLDQAKKALDEYIQ
ncbi:hypothetical protein [Pseudoalteromonas rubra]|uniref:hypothetical protein n=1 Tax=Pseudoalteromonas rubra TaxID=43658 RepID=UPI002DB83870|nr:hypothetical protein [Pseudoalteromonas rubra]MEC4091611.1 hypothetical protein [Pseudoalteromonas rubra]